MNINSQKPIAFFCLRCDCCLLFYAMSKAQHEPLASFRSQLFVCSVSVEKLDVVLLNLTTRFYCFKSSVCKGQPCPGGDEDLYTKKTANSVVFEREGNLWKHGSSSTLSARVHKYPTKL
jgi:hypothetical protein